MSPLGLSAPSPYIHDSEGDAETSPVHKPVHSDHLLKRVLTTASPAAALQLGRVHTCSKQPQSDCAMLSPAFFRAQTPLIAVKHLLMHQCITFLLP